ncbi:MAG: hypothetical protein WBG18_18820 [Xanthobacteraceae bacterium]
MAGTRLNELTQQIVEEITRLQQEKQALEITVKNLQNHRREAEEWLELNWPRYSLAKADFDSMKKRARELGEGLERAGV